MSKVLTKNRKVRRNLAIDALMVIPGLVVTALVFCKLLPQSAFYVLFAAQCIAIVYLGFIVDYLPGYNKKQGLAYTYTGKIAGRRAFGLLLFTVANFLFSVQVLARLF